MDFYGRDELLVDLDSLWGKNSPSLSEISGAISVGAGGNVGELYVNGELVSGNGVHEFGNLVITVLGE